MWLAGVGTGFCFLLGGQGRPLCRGVSDNVLKVERASFSIALSSPQEKEAHRPWRVRHCWYKAERLTQITSRDEFIERIHVEVKKPRSSHWDKFQGNGGGKNLPSRHRTKLFRNEKLLRIQCLTPTIIEIENPQPPPLCVADFCLCLCFFPCVFLPWLQISMASYSSKCVH